MTFPSSGLLASRQNSLNNTLVQSNAALTTPSTTPLFFKTGGVVGVNANASVSIAASGYGASQGICANPSCMNDVVIPQQMVNIQNSLLAMANLVYRM